MELRKFQFLACVFILLTLPEQLKGGIIRRKRYSQAHIPPWNTPTFRRDAVEHVPEWISASPYTNPDTFGSHSLPLRSAVESVPPIELSSLRLPLRDAVEKRPPPDESVDIDIDFPNLENLGFLELSGFSNLPPVRSYLSPDENYYRIAPKRPYRVDNRNQQLLRTPFGRGLQEDQAAKLVEGNKNLNEKYQTLEQAVKYNEAHSSKIVCYIEGKAVYRKEPLSFSSQDLDPYACTHVIYAFASIDPHSYYVVPHDHEYEVVKGGFRAATGLKRSNPDLKVLISVGGGREEGAHRFSNMVAVSSRRKDFIRSLIDFIDTYGFDGVDIHWQYPGAEEMGGRTDDKENFELLLEELSEVLKARRLLLSVAVPASRFRVEDGYDPKKLDDFVDFINLQAYDFHADREPMADHHSPVMKREHDAGLNIFYNVDYSVRYWLKRGMPPTKIVLGIPFYGVSFTLRFANSTEPGSDIRGPGREGFYTQTPGMLAYFEICDAIVNEGWHKARDSIGDPYIYSGDQWVGYDDEESIERKMLYIKDMGLGGAFIWAVDMDDFRGLCENKWPLLATVKRSLKGGELSENQATKPTGVCNKDGLYSDPKDCSAYYICRSGLSYHLACASNMLFDVASGQCGYITASQCRPGQIVYIKKVNPSENEVKLQKIDDKPKVVCYMTNWSFYRKGEAKFVPEHLDQRLCSHVVYAYSSLEPEQLVIKEFDPWADLDNNLYERVTSLQDTKVLLALGGWTDSAGDKYSRLVGDGSARRRFVVSVVSFLRRYNFDGLHIDWNYPKCWQSNCKKGPSSDKPNFTKLIQELRSEFNKQKPPLILAAAISGYKEVIDVAYELAPLGKALDFMSVMTYDYHGSWERKTGHVSPLYESPGDKYPQYNTNYTMEYLVKLGAPRDKLLVGIPFYGQTFTLAKHDNKYEQGIPAAGPGEPGEFTKQPGMLSYYEICYRTKNQRWNVVRDRNRATGPYAYNRDQWVGYDDIESVKEKAAYIKEHGFGGAVAWTVDLDDFSNRCCQEPFPLLRSINRGLDLFNDPPRLDCTKPPEPVTPPAPTLTTGVDTGAVSTTPMTTHHHEHTTWPGWNTSKKPSTTTSSTSSTTPWWQRPSTSESTTVSSKPTTPWWQRPSTSKPTTTTIKSTVPWWVPSTPSTRPTTTITTTESTTSTSTTTRRTTTPWWQTESTTIPTPAVVMPVTESHIPSSCDPGTYLPDKQNCNAYYRCILGEYKKQYCAGGLHWNVATNVCDWPHVAKCEQRKVKPQTTTTKKPFTFASRKTTVLITQKTTWPTWSTRPTTLQTTERQTEPTTPPTLEKCTNGLYYPHELCSSFYVCVNGVLVSQQCGPNLHWNQEASMCDWSYKVKCIARRPMKHVIKYQLHTPKSKCEAGSYSPLPGDCSQYMLCLWGKYQTFSCAPGLHWNDETKICDWPINAQCTNDGGSEVPEIPDSVFGETPEEPSEKPSRPSTSKPTYKPPYRPEIETPNTPKPATTTTTTTVPSSTAPAEPLSGYFKIVCYFTNWAWYRRGIGKYTPEDIDPNLCTHIVYGFAVLDYENLIVRAHDSWADFDNRFYERVVAYKAKGLKVSLALGGWNDSAGDKYSRLVNSPAARARFIKHMLGFLEKYEFDGLDLDWEYPKCWQVDCKKGPDSDKPAFAAFVTEIKEAFKPKGYLLSAAVSPSKTVIDAGYDVPVLAKYLDWVAVMTYDFHGQWDKQTGHVAPLYYHPDDEVSFFNANFSINYWISEGVPRRKIVMGMPLYGQSFQLEKASNNGLNAIAPGPGQAGEYTKAAGFLAYYEICNRIKNGWTVVHDPLKRMGPYAYKGNQWVSFDDVPMIREKSEYIRKMDLGGGMIWALDLDDFRNRCGEGPHPLLNTIREVLRKSGTGVVEPIDLPVPEQPETTSVSTTKVPKVPSVIVPTKHSTTVSPVSHRGSDFKVVCYFTNWSWYRQGVGKFLPSDIDPELCTHIVYGFAVLNGDQLIIKPHDTWADYDNKFYEKVTALKSKGIKVLIALGGWNDSAGDKYSRLVNSPSARKRFVAHVTDFVETNNFDGLDLDWEYPKCWQVDCRKGPESDKEAFAALVRELRQAFSSKGFLLSSAVSPAMKVIDAGYDVPTLSRYLDWIAVMAYDYHGQWDKITGHVAPMYVHPEDVDMTFNANFTIHYWIEKGADRKKLVMGMPLYGQSFSLADNNKHGLNAPTYGGGEAGDSTRARGFLSYYEICTNIQKKGWKVVRDPRGRMGPYAYLRDQWVSFDDIPMIQHKSEFIKAMGLGGGMVWALDLDDFRNVCGCEEYPLLRTINRVLRGYKISQPQCQLETHPPEESPSTLRPESSSFRPQSSSSRPQITSTMLSVTPEVDSVIPIHIPCEGRLFTGHETDCNKYYLCNQGQLQLQACPEGLYWNENHCDWPENTECHPDSTVPSVGIPAATPKPTTEPPEIVPEVITTSKPFTPGTDSVIPEDTGYKVVCYFTNWAWYRQDDGKYTPNDIDPKLCTHITYGFAVLDSNSLTIKPHDSWADIDNEFYRKVTALKSKGIKVLIALGGWNDSLGNKYSRLVNDPQARARFVTHVSQFIDKWGFDGLDLDWEYPKCWQVDCNKGPDSDKQGFASLVAELSAAFKPKGWLLSSAVSPSKAVIDAGYDVPSLSKHFDWIAVMTYDFHGHWDKQTGHVAPLYYYPGDTYDYFNANFSLNYWIQQGAPPKKIIMGMPLYGQSFSLADTSKNGLNAKAYGPGEAGEYTRAGGFLAFYEICERVKRRSWTVVRDPLGRIGPYAHMNNQWVSYDDISEIRRKSNLVKDLGLGGGMIWALDLDDFRNKCGCGKHPLLSTLNNELRGIPSTATVTDCT